MLFNTLLWWCRALTACVLWEITMQDLQPIVDFQEEVANTLVRCCCHLVLLSLLILLLLPLALSLSLVLSHHCHHHHHHLLLPLLLLSSLMLILILVPLPSLGLLLLQLACVVLGTQPVGPIDVDCNISCIKTIKVQGARWLPHLVKEAHHDPCDSRLHDTHMILDYMTHTRMRMPAAGIGVITRAAALHGGSSNAVLSATCYAPGRGSTTCLFIVRGKPYV